MTPEMIHLFVSRAGAKAEPRTTRRPLAQSEKEAALWPEPRTFADRHDAEFPTLNALAFAFALVGMEIHEREPYGQNGMGPIPPLTQELLGLYAWETVDGRLRVT